MSVKRAFILLLCGLAILEVSCTTSKPAVATSETKTAKTEKEKPKAQADSKKEKPKDEKEEEAKKDDGPTPSGPQTDGNFRKVILDADEKAGDKYEDTLKEPMELSVATDGRVFYVERAGKVKLWKPGSTQSSLVGELNVFHELEDGLLGVTLDPGFLENNWIYLNYSLPQTGTNALGKKVGTNRIARFTVTGDKLDPASEKVLLEIQTQREQCCHSGGSLAFDGKGNLYISAGDNTNPFDSDGFAPIDERKDRSPWDAQKSAANESDLRGKVMRIHPEADGTCTIPAGNLFPNGKQHRGILGLFSHRTAPRPEIYTMGCRNPFRISVDKKNGYLYWGDVGPDAKEFKENRGPAGMDEVNQAREAGYFGWPYFVGENKPYWKRDFKADTNAVPKMKFDPAHPVNKSPNNSGPRNLPAAHAAFIWYGNGPSVKFPVVNGEGGRSACAGPIYYFDENLKSKHKLPKEFDHTLFIFDWSRNWIIAVHLDRENNIEKMERFCSKMTFKRPIDLELGADGCLYLLEWGTAWGNNKDSQLVRIEYSPSESENKLAESPSRK